MRRAIVILLVALFACVPPCSSGAPSAPAGSTPKPSISRSSEDLALEGEKRFRTNCGRCHQAPHKYPPAVMATAIRHMRVRATITDEDMRLILNYMTR
jgi:hypothetical protein